MEHTWIVHKQKCPLAYSYKNHDIIIRLDWWTGQTSGLGRLVHLLSCMRTCILCSDELFFKDVLCILYNKIHTKIILHYKLFTRCSLYLTTKARRLPRRSCIFMPWYLVPHFQVSHFLPPPLIIFHIEADSWLQMYLASFLVPLVRNFVKTSHCCVRIFVQLRVVFCIVWFLYCCYHGNMQ